MCAEPLRQPVNAHAAPHRHLKNEQLTETDSCYEMRQRIGRCLVSHSPAWTTRLRSFHARIIGDEQLGRVPIMFKLVATMRRGSASGLAAAWARYPTVEAARLGTATLLRDDRNLACHDRQQRDSTSL